MNARQLMVLLFGLLSTLIPVPAQAVTKFRCGIYHLAGRWERLPKGRVELVLYVVPLAENLVPRAQQRVEILDLDPEDATAWTLSQGELVKVEVYVPEVFKGDGVAIFRGLLDRPDYEELTSKPIKFKKPVRCGLEFDE